MVSNSEKIACTPTSSDSDPCTYRFCKANSDVCKLRIDFDTMVLTAPTTISSTGYYRYYVSVNIFSIILNIFSCCY